MASGLADRAIYVIATTPEGTERALDEARHRANAAAQIVLIVPAVVPEGHTTADTAHLVTEFGSLAARAGVRPPFVCVCREPREVLAGFPLHESTLIIVGGPTWGLSRLSPERDLARRLVRDGHDVVFVADPGLQIIIGSDGTVLGATGPWPPSLLDAHLEDCDDLPRGIREAGRGLLHELRRSGNRVAVQVVALDDGTLSVQLIAVEALPIRRTVLDLRTLLASKLNVISSQASEAGVALIVTVADDIPPGVSLDAEKVAWMVTDLVGNALRYVRTGSRRMHSGRIDVRARFDPAHSQLTIEVQDDGPGIPADTIERLFKRDGLNVQGAGLALLVMADVCAAHGGTVDVHSATDVAQHGTTVRLTFPTD